MRKFTLTFERKQLPGALFISSSERSFLCVAIEQRRPNGSSSLPWRSPELIFDDLGLWCRQKLLYWKEHRHHRSIRHRYWTSPYRLVRMTLHRGIFIWLHRQNLLTLIQHEQPYRRTLHTTSLFSTKTFFIKFYRFISIFHN